jgi:hypothetical protein
MTFFRTHMGSYVSVRQVTAFEFLEIADEKRPCILARVADRGYYLPANVRTPGDLSSYLNDRFPANILVDARGDSI